MIGSARWTAAILMVVAALIAALVIELRNTARQGGGPPQPGGPAATAGRQHRDADTEAALAEPRQLADLPPCPTGTDKTDPQPPRDALQGVTVECAADGSAVDVAAAFAGHRVVLNLWAYWCVPCRDELPAMAEYQRRAGPKTTVATVHQDENETAALLRLAELGVRLPTLQDGRRRVAAALHIPNVMPATVVLAADGSVAEILPRAFANADEIAGAVGE